VSTWSFDSTCIVTFAPIHTIFLPFNIFFPWWSDRVYLSKVVTFWFGNAKPS
jgi:hypothetical protein